MEKTIDTFKEDKFKEFIKNSIIGFGEINIRVENKYIDISITGDMNLDKPIMNSLHDDLVDDMNMECFKGNFMIIYSGKLEDIDDEYFEQNVLSEYDSWYCCTNNNRDFYVPSEEAEIDFDESDKFSVETSVIVSEHEIYKVTPGTCVIKCDFVVSVDEDDVVGEVTRF